MALYSIQGETLGEIADAIREQTGTEEPIQTNEMSSMIRKIEGGSPNAVLYTEQNLTDEQKAQARENIGAAAIGGENAVLYTEQDLTLEQKNQARKNIDIHVGEEPADADEGAVWIDPDDMNLILGNAIMAEDINDGDVEIFGSFISEDTVIAKDKNSDGNIVLQTYISEEEKTGVNKSLQSITFPGLPDTYIVPSKAEDVGAASLKYARQIGNPRNLLDNSDFTNPVNQRGQTSYTATGSYIFTIDRWKTNYGIVTVNDGYINWTANEEAQYKRLIQIIPHTLKAGQAYTLAMLARVNQTDYTGLRFAENGGAGVSGARVALSTTNDFTWFVISCNMNQDVVEPRLEILTGSETNQNINIDIKAMALYEGEYTIENLPEYQPKGYAIELLECQRYFLKIVDTDTINLFAAMAYATTDATTFVPIPILMRVNPTISWEKLYLRNGTTDVAITSIGQPYQYGSGIYMRLTTGGSLTKGSLYMVRPISGKMSFSADL